MEFGMFYEVQVPRPSPPEAEHQRLREIIDQVVLAEEMGFDPNVWFHNVEIVASREIGRETVQYVSNIYKYYVAFRRTLEMEEARARRS